ncbi:MAG: citrate lyase holo-[acyl-carrier protein] synthase [bacterium]|jgi:holo-ACP synthase
MDRILDGREQRYELEKDLLNRYHAPILVATINYPGPEKVNPTVWFIFQELERAVASIELKHQITGVNGAGPYLMGVLTAHPKEIKKKTVSLENQHFLGRLFDLDVIVYPYQKIGRKEIGAAERKCLLCGQRAVECVRGRKHTVAEVLQKINMLVEEYTNGTK